MLVLLNVFVTYTIKMSLFTVFIKIRYFLIIYHHTKFHNAITKTVLVFSCLIRSNGSRVRILGGKFRRKTKREVSNGMLFILNFIRVGQLVHLFESVNRQAVS
jgi:hypothetical protein